MNVDSLFSYCSDDLSAVNAYHFINPIPCINSLITLSFNGNDNKILSHSNDFLSIIKSCYELLPSYRPIYNLIVTFYNYYINNKNYNIYYPYKVLNFITSFSLGNNHGYTGILNIIHTYVTNYQEFKDYKIIVYKKSQNGILQIIEHLIFKNYINKDSIIYLDAAYIYKFDEIRIIKNKYHASDNNLEYLYMMNNFLYNFVISDRLNTEYYKSLKFPENNDRICIIKNNTSENMPNNIGVIDIERVKNFANNNNLTIIEPKEYNEINLIHLIHNCKIFVASWGTSYYKNLTYISDNCVKIIVLILGQDYLEQYNSLLNANILLFKYRNADIQFIVSDMNLTVPPELII